MRSTADLAAVLRDLRRRLADRGGEAKLTFRELADRTGLSRSAINDYLTGKVLPPTDRFDILLTVFEVDPDERRAFATARDRVEEHLHLTRSTRTPERRVPHELPSGVSAFTGRQAESAALDRALRTCADTTAPGIAVVWGTAGVGKTALATHWAHANRHRFPDGEVYLDLRGHHPERPLEPAEALARLIRSVAGDAAVPDALEERAARFRTLIADRAVLVVLDNAASVDQVHDLLPGRGAFTLVTSRHNMAGLVVRRGALRIRLDLLPQGDALALLRAVLGHDRVTAEPRAAAALVECCARLPLALRIAAEHIAERPAASLADLVHELRQEPLGLLDLVGDDRTAPRTVFSWSYRHLPAHVATAFRRLGSHPGRDIDAPTLAALCDVDIATARRTLSQLANASMVAETDHDRFAPHDLLRGYAAELASPEDTA
ncbi:MAG: helix-turn-helix domain-containing protein, partial [Saccharothrix sp.]|nr:helix-turn-helix domain-containing protein [Saccharothrix sp.]